MGIEEIAGVIGTTILLAGATAAVTSAAQSPGKADTPTPSATPLPPAPSPDTSLADAQAAAETRRKTILASGGQTVLTQQGMPGVGSGKGKTLLGS